MRNLLIAICLAVSTLAAEDDLQATRKDHAALLTQRDAARTRRDAEIARVSFETDLSVVTQSTQYGNRPPQP